MAISKVKDVASYTSGTALVSSFTLTVPAGGVAVGNTLLVMGGRSGIVSISDSRSNTYNVRGGGGNNLFLADTRITTALLGGDIITVTLTTTDRIGAVAVEYTGIHPVSPFVAAAQGSWSSGIGATGGAITTTDGTELVLGLFRSGALQGTAGNPTPQITSPGAGYTNETGAGTASSGAASGHGFDWESRIGPAPGSQTATATWNVTDGGQGITAAYKALSNQSGTVV